MNRLHTICPITIRRVFLVSIGFIFLLMASLLVKSSDLNLYLKVKQEQPRVELASQLAPQPPPCIDPLATKFGRVEDIFCLVLPQFTPKYKNPCFYDVVAEGKRKLHCLPYFLIIGMDKSGTTDLHNRLANHPQIRGNYGVLQKEVAFWTWSRYGAHTFRYNLKRKQLSDYLDHFGSTASELEKLNTSDIITGDATPMDLWDYRSWNLVPQNKNITDTIFYTPHFIKYIHKKNPKFILQFREPVERLFSDFVFLHQGKSPTQFHKAAIQAISMMNSCLQHHPRRYCFFSREIYDQLPCRIHLGGYSVFLKEWLNVYPLSAFHITRTTEYASDMQSTIASVFKFLGVDPLPPQQLHSLTLKAKVHVTSDKKGKTMLPETFQALRRFYQPFNEEMADLIQDPRFLWKDHYNKKYNVSDAMR